MHIRIAKAGKNTTLRKFEGMQNSAPDRDIGNVFARKRSGDHCEELFSNFHNALPSHMIENTQIKE